MEIALATKTDFDEIRDWLFEERRSTSEGFACNIGAIEKFFEKGEMLCAKVEGFPVSFLTWSLNQLVCTLEVAETKPSHRGRGIGRSLVSAFHKKMVDQFAIVSTLECSPQESEGFWRENGYVNYPDLGLNRGRISCGTWMYFPLLKCANALPEGFDSESLEIMELWKKEYGASNTPPDSRWHIVRERDSIDLLCPIVAPASPKWTVRWRVGEVVVAEVTTRDMMGQQFGWDGFFILPCLDRPEDYSGPKNMLCD